MSTDADKPCGGAPLDKAEQIIRHSTHHGETDGCRVVQTLLAGRHKDQLSVQELRTLAKGYNWWGKHELASEAAMEALERDLASEELMIEAGSYLVNAYGGDLSHFIFECDRCIERRIGPPAYWYLLKADAYLHFATGEMEAEDYEWQPGHPIAHPEALDTVATQLDKAVKSEPRLRQIATECKWVGDWTQRFGALAASPKYTHLLE